MKFIKKYDSFLLENKTNSFIYDLIDADFVKVLRSYVPKEIFSIKGDKIISQEDLSKEYEIALKFYKKFYSDKIKINNYNDLFKYSAEKYIDELGHEGFNDIEDAIEYVDNLLNSDFPNGFKNMSDEVTLYRVLFIENPNKVKISDFGQHYIANIDMIDSDFLLSIGGEQFDWDETPPYIFKLTININEIDFYHTISNNLLYPNEFEITTKHKKPKVNIVNYINYNEL